MLKTLVVKKNKTVFRVAMFAVLVFATVPALGATEFEVGTQFGVSHLIPGDDDSTTSITYTRVPSGTFLDIGSSPTSLYATWFLNKQFAIGPEFSFGRISVSQEYWGEEETESITTLYLGGRAAFFLQSHLESSPYVLGRVSQTIFIDEDALFVDEGGALTGFGIGFGYQWRIGTAFCLLRSRGAVYQRLFSLG